MFFVDYLDVYFSGVVLYVDGFYWIVLCVVCVVDLWFVCIGFVLYFVDFDGCNDVFYLEDVVDYCDWFDVVEDYDFYVGYFYGVFFVVFVRFGVVLYC